MAAPTSSSFDVAVVGSGFGGLGMAIGLERAGCADFVVLERAGEVGGTWRDNTYPGAACDVPSNLYSFSFAPNPDWTSSFSPQEEIQAYLRRCADRFGIRPHIRFHHQVTSARWDGDARRWQIETTGGRLTARVLVSARGPLSEPSVPALPGLERFAGTMFHSARWDHGHRLAGERVAVVGTGASAVQFVPRIQPEVGRLHVFQRTPPWVIPRHDRTFTALEHRLFRAVPATQLAARAAVYWGREAYVLGFVGSNTRRRRMMGPAETVARRHLAAQVPDPALRARLMPSYEMGCKRILISDDYYPALGRPNVELVTDGIAEVRPRSIVTSDGTERPIDTIVFGTGFDVTGHASAAHTYGRDGRPLADAWSGGMAAYKGTTVAGFPNLFLIVGPNSGLGHTSIVFVIESQIAYVLDCLGTMRRRGADTVEVRREHQDAWTDAVAEHSRHTVWTAGGCDSYYLDAHGRNVAVWPGSSWSFRRALRRFDAGAYHLGAAPAGGPAVPVAGPTPEVPVAGRPAPGARHGAGGHGHRPRHAMSAPRTRIAGGLAVVTGAGSGIGRATAAALARRGARVLAVDVDAAGAQATAEACGGEAYQVDVADRAAMEELGRAVASAHGVPDLVVNDAGVGMTGRFLDTTPEDWEWILGVNLLGVVHGCQVFGPGMVARGSGHVVNVSSGLAYTPRATEPAYVTTKAAVLALSQCLRADWGPAGVGVSAICPGVIDTPIVARARYRGARADSAERVRRIFSRGHPPALVAEAVVGAVERNRPVVPVGLEAHLGWALHRLLPTRAVDRGARATLGGV